MSVIPNSDIKLADLLADNNAGLLLDLYGVVSYHGHNVAKLVAGDDFYKPNLELLSLDVANMPYTDQQAYKQRLSSFVECQIANDLAVLYNLRKAENLPPIAQELAAILWQHCGVVPRNMVSDKLASLPQEERALLRRLGARFGRFHVYLFDILKPAQVKMLLMLWLLRGSEAERNKLGEKANDILAALLHGRTTIIYDPTVDKKLYNLAGYDFWGDYAIRVDIAERLSTYIQLALSWRVGSQEKPQGAYDGYNFVLTSWALSLLGLSYGKAAEVLAAMGYLAKRIHAPADIADDVALAPQDEASELEKTTSETLPELDLWYFLKPQRSIVQKARRAPKVEPKSQLKFKSKFKPKKTRENPNTDSPFAALGQLRKDLASAAKKNSNKP